MYFVIKPPTTRVVLAVALLCVTGRAQLRKLSTGPPLPPEQLKVETLKVVDILKHKPGWLFPAEACPAEVMAERGAKPEYGADGCAGNPTRCLDKCKTDDPTACYALALLIQQYTDIGHEASEALFLRSCKLGIVSGCTNWAVTMVDSQPDNVSVEKCAADTFVKTCSKDDPWGCAMWGSALSQGIGTKKDVPEALRFLQKACDISVDKAGPACKRSQELRDAIIRHEKLEKEVKN